MRKFKNLFTRKQKAQPEESVIYGHAPDVIDLAPSEWRNLDQQVEPVKERTMRFFTPTKEQLL